MPQVIAALDDEPDILELLKVNLRKAGYRFEGFQEAEDLYGYLGREKPDLILLDLMLPGTDGLEVCRHIRRSERFADIPIIMLTARGEVMDRVVGLELGADDYLPKPFEPRELVARIQTVLRRRKPHGNGHAAAPGAAPTLKFEGLEVDVARRAVRCSGQEVELTGTEYELLLMLAREPGRVFSRDDILNQLRGHEADLYTRAVDIVVSRLRKKLEPLDCIKTLRNAGYSLALGREG